MSMERFITWLATDAGKKFSYFATGGTATAVLSGYVLPNTLLIDKYIDILRLYKKGFSAPLSEKLQNRFQRALELCEIRNVDKLLFKPFAVYGFDVFSAGHIGSKFGVRIGLPANFSYEDPTTVDKSIIKLQGNYVLWETDEGQLLLKSLVLSENAQLYAMAREIKYRQSFKFPFDTVLSTFSLICTYGLGKTINDRYNMFARPLSFRLVLYVLVAAFGSGSYLLSKDMTQVYVEQKIDKELKEKDPLFIEGGREFYQKLIDRNIALRKLLGKEGERAYTALGNDNYLFRHKHIPLVQRKQMFEA